MSKENKILLLFCLPAFLLYGIFVLYPAIGGFWYSLTNWNGLNPTYDYVGFSNYKRLLEDKYFIESLLFTSKYVLYMVVLQNLIALFLAIIIESLKKGKTILRTIFFFPNMISMIIGGFIWLFIFTEVFPYLVDSFGLMFLDHSWIGDPIYSFYSILILSLWGGVGYLMVIYIAALQNIPKSLLEAAKIDGASPLQSIWYIVRPLIANSITIGIFISLSTSFKVFDQVYALTGGGPGRATQVVSLNIFNEAFAMQNRYGYASAKAVILFLLILLITGIQLAVMKRKEVEM
ncbi:MAG: sugar ABC transporter permease [Halanaerobiales bacterium]|nr:sugar ABC transporter permease [Halanaerobiales bacterium]